MVLAGVSPGMAIMSRPTEQTLVMASSFSRLSRPEVAAASMLESSETGMKAPDRPPTEEEAKAPPFFTASLSMASTAVVPGAPMLDRPTLWRDLAHAVAHGRGGGQGKVGYAEGQAQTLGHFVTDHLAHAGHLVGRTLDDFGHIQQGHGLAAVTAVLQGAVDGLLDHAGAGDAHVDDHVGLAHAQVGTGHEGHVLRDVGEDHQLGAAKAAAVGRGLSHLERSVRPIRATASILMPEREEATLMEEQMRSVVARASGSDAMSARSPAAKPFSTRAEKPPRKSTPTVLAARSRA